MSPKTLLCVVILALAINEGWTLKCYLCLGSPQSDCAKRNKVSMITQTCVAPPGENMHHRFVPELENDVARPVVSCVSFKGLNQNATIFERSCAVTSGEEDVCDILRKVLKIYQCKSCKKDLCN